MELGMLATGLYFLIKPVLISKAAGEIKDVSKKVWAKLQASFIKDNKDSEELKDLKENPDQKVFEEAFIAKLKAKLAKDANLRKELEKMMKEIENSDNEEAKISIRNSKKFIIGNVDGDVYFGKSDK